MRVAIVIGFIVAFISAMAAFVVLSINHIETGPFITFIGGAATALVPQLFTLLKAHTTSQQVANVQPIVEQVQSDMAEVKERTNGPLSAMSSKIDSILMAIGDLGHRVSNLENKP